MIEQDVLARQRSGLTSTIRDLQTESEPHSIAFALRVIGKKRARDQIEYVKPSADQIGYGGYPMLSSVGFALAEQIGEGLDCEDASSFINGVVRLTQRPRESLDQLAADDLAILGIADGIASLESTGQHEQIGACREWLLALIGRHVGDSPWSARIRALAAELLDNRGRLRTNPVKSQVEYIMLEIALSCTWPNAFSGPQRLVRDDYHSVLRGVLEGPIPAGNIESAAVWLTAVDVVIEGLCDSLLPDHVIDLRRQLESVKSHLDWRADRQTSTIFWGMFVLIVGVLSALVFWIVSEQIPWDEIEPWTYLASIVLIVFGTAYFIYFRREYSLAAIRDRVNAIRKAKLYGVYGVDLSQGGSHEPENSFGD